VYGLVGRDSRAINWEAGVLWLGARDLWEEARAVARAGFSAFRLGTPRASASPTPEADDELGPADTDELQRVFEAYAARCIRVNRRSRHVMRSATADKSVRALGRGWLPSSFKVWVELKSHFRYLGELKLGKFVKIPQDARAQVRVEFRVDADQPDSIGGPPFADAMIDLIELDPEPPGPQVTVRSSMAAARVGLMTGGWDSNGEARGEQNAGRANSVLSDVRFPFSEFFALLKTRPRAAEGWLDRLARFDEPALAQLPEHWRRIAKELREST
jgi:hypothetical protein